MMNSYDFKASGDVATEVVGAEDIRVRVRGEEAPAPRKPQVSVKRITGFGPMARITTSFGEVHAHVLRVGDMVRTSNGQYEKISKINRIRLDEEFLKRYPSVLPIKMRKGSLGPNMPAEDVQMAPYQKLRMGPPRATSPLVFAAKLLERPFVERATESQITYTTFSVGRAASVYCEGMLVDIDA